MKHLMFVVYLILFFPVFGFLFSCKSLEEKKLYESLVEKHSCYSEHRDSILFGLVIDEPKVIVMAKLYEKGLYSEKGRSSYTIQSSNEYIRKLIWDYDVSFYNDSLKGACLSTPVSELDVDQTKRSLIDLFKQKYTDYCSYEGSDCFFYGNVMIQIECKQFTSIGSEYRIYLRYEQVYWFPHVDFPVYGESDEYGNDELHNYYSERYKAPNKKKDPALDSI